MDEEEEDVLAPKEPQVTSHDPEERKAARSLRIKKRQDALKRAEQPLEEIVTEEEQGLIEQATNAAAEELQRLSLDGAAKVTNVKVTTDEREVFRRNSVFDQTQHNLTKIEEEATDAQAQFEAITSNWDSMLKLKDPLDIDAAIQEQRQKCDKLLKQKNALIDELKEDLARMDENYYEDLQKQDRDIKELSDRIERQITLMQRAYNKQLMLIAEAIAAEREAMIEHNNKRWEALYKQRDREEVVHMEYKEQQLEDHKQVVEDIMWDHCSKYREAKIELESLVQELQREIEKLKATCLINTEKIGYTYQVLKKREEENVFVRSQQKRKLNKMSDVANKLRSKIRKAAEDGAAEEIRADAEIVKLMSAMDDLEKKCYQSCEVNNNKFTQIWRMSTMKCSDLSRELRKAEVAIHAHVLSEPAPPPPPPPPRNPLRMNPEISDDGTGNATLDKQISSNFNNPSVDDKDSKDRLVRHLLALVADNTGFLVEDRLLTLIEKYPMTSRNLCTLDAIFMALEIQAEEDIELLCKIFMKYAFCPICVGIEEYSDIVAPSTLAGDHPDDGPASVRGEKTSIRTRASIARSLSCSMHALSRLELSLADQQLQSEADEILQKCGDPQVGMLNTATSLAESGSAAAGATARRARGVTVSDQPKELPTHDRNPYLCHNGHPLEIEPMQVLTALGEFIKVFVPPEKRKLYDILDSVEPPDFTTPSRILKNEDIKQYWSQWKIVFPPEKDRFYDGLIQGLNNYLKILQDREHLHDEVVVLRKKNSELRNLVRGALPELKPSPPIPNYLRPPFPGVVSCYPENYRPPLTFPPIKNKCGNVCTK